MKKIGLTKFSERHFTGLGSVTYVHDRERLLSDIEYYCKYLDDNLSDVNVHTRDDDHIKVVKGEFEFSRLVTLKNTYGIKLSTMPINLITSRYLVSDYVKRTPKELPVLSRWIQLPPNTEIPSADSVTLVLYSAKQLMLENENMAFEEIVDYQWGVVAIISHSGSMEPIPPITQMRNSLGLSEGGNGETLDREAYLKSVKFWSCNALVKTS